MAAGEVTTMKAAIDRASSARFEEEREFHSLAELMGFIRENDRVIIGSPNPTADKWFVTIYDDYVE